MAREKKKAEANGEARTRASWKGNLRFGLVSFPVQGFNARAKEAEIAFHQLHSKCHSRIRYQKICPLHGPVDNDEIISGYEYAKDRYVELEPEELEQLRTDRERSLTIDSFVEPHEIDPVYRDGRAYYLAPDGAEARQPYAVFLEALQHESRYGVGQVVFSHREQLVLVRPYAGALVMEMLLYESQVRNASDVVAESHVPKNASREVRMAQQLIDNWTDEHFDISRYVDPYRDKVKQLVDAKVKGREVVVPEAEEEPEVINLMDALRKSVSRGKKKESDDGAPAPHRRHARSRRRHAS
ncbi:MAG TPA: Ku protein [Planctomycetaceae bacterium]|nr:Ku protein [Planctomycetaceae bacterium]